MTQALILVDIQKDYFPGGDMELVGMESAAGKAAELLARFREAGQPLFHVRHEFEDPAAPFFKPGSAGAVIHDVVAPAAGETVITKHQVNSFQGTSLAADLEAAGVDDVVIVGAMSHMCIEGTARAAADHGLRCTVVHDACATRDLEFGGDVIPAAQVHGTAMASLGFAYADIVDSEHLLR